jgi:hypothetical protein
LLAAISPQSAVSFDAECRQNVVDLVDERLPLLGQIFPFTIRASRNCRTNASRTRSVATCWTDRPQVRQRTEHPFRFIRRRALAQNSVARRLHLVNQLEDEIESIEQQFDARSRSTEGSSRSSESPDSSDTEGRKQRLGIAHGNSPESCGVPRKEADDVWHSAGDLPKPSLASTARH